MKIKQILTIIFPATGIFFLTGLAYCIWETRKLSERFDKTTLNISTAQLKSIWGNPDNEFDIPGTDEKKHILKYEDIFGYTYIFASNKGEAVISEKYMAD